MPTYVCPSGHILQTGKSGLGPEGDRWIGVKAVSPNVTSGAISVYTSKLTHARDEVRVFNTEEDLLTEMVERTSALRVISLLPTVIREISGLIDIPEFANGISF